MNASPLKSPLALIWDLVLVPQGAEFVRVNRSWQRGLKQAPMGWPLPPLLALPAGPEPVRRFLHQWWAQKTFTPQRVLLLGLAGSLTPSLSLGDRLIYSACGQEPGPQWLTPEQTWVAALQNQIPHLKMVRGWSSAQVVTRVEEKRALAEKYQAQAIDMENGAILSFLEALGVTCTILRVVSDDLSGDLPDLQYLYDPQGRLRASSLAIAAAKNPLAGAKLITGAWQGLKSLEELASVLSVKG